MGQVAPRLENTDEEDPFLGLSDLRAQLAGRPPTMYDPAAIDDFLHRHDGPYGMGELRGWLCGKRRRYGPQAIDLHLRSLDIEELRRTRATLAAHSDGYLAALLPRGIPLLVNEWAHMLTWQLAVGNCECPGTVEWAKAAFRAYFAGDQRCRVTHFISGDNLRGAEGRYTDPLKFVERAVTGACSLSQQARGFGHSMFCAVYTTPGGGSIRLIEHDGNDALTETGGEWTTAGGTTEDGPATGLFYPCFGCSQHRVFVGARTPRRTECLRQRHYWLYATVESAEELEGEFAAVDVNTCQARHVWPAGRAGSNADCPFPGCGLQAVAINRKVEVLHATKRPFDEIDWAPTLPELRKEAYHDSQD